MAEKVDHMISSYHQTVSSKLSQMIAMWKTFWNMRLCNQVWSCSIQIFVKSWALDMNSKNRIIWEQTEIIPEQMSQNNKEVPY